MYQKYVIVPLPKVERNKIDHYQKQKHKKETLIKKSLIIPAFGPQLDSRNLHQTQCMMINMIHWQDLKEVDHVNSLGLWAKKKKKFCQYWEQYRC